MYTPTQHSSSITFLLTWVWKEKWTVQQQDCIITVALWMRINFALFWFRPLLKETLQHWVHLGCVCTFHCFDCYHEVWTEVQFNERLRPLWKGVQSKGDSAASSAPCPVEFRTSIALIVSSAVWTEVHRAWLRINLPSVLGMIKAEQSQKLATSGTSFN